MDILGVEGATSSEKIRNLIDKLYETLTATPPSQKPVSSAPVKPQTSDSCVSRFEHEGDYFCVTRRGHAKILLTLKSPIDVFGVHTQLLAMRAFSFIQNSACIFEVTASNTSANKSSLAFQ